MIVELLFSGKLSPEKLLKASSVFVPAPDVHCHRPNEEKSNSLEREDEKVDLKQDLRLTSPGARFSKAPVNIFLNVFSPITR